MTLPTSLSIPATFSEAHFLPMLPHAARRDDVAGNKQVYGGHGPCTPHASSASVSATLPKGYTAILINFTV